MKKELNYYDFRNFANKRLHRIKEERITQYAKYVEEHFGRLIEDHREDLEHIAKHYGLNMEQVAVDEKVSYAGKEYDYFIHDDTQYIALNKDLIIIDAGDFNVEELTSMTVVSEDAKADYDRMKDHIYSQREARALANMKLKETNPAEYEKREKAATDDFIRQLKDLKQFARSNNI